MCVCVRESVCVCVSVRERERWREGGKEGEGEREYSEREVPVGAAAQVPRVVERRAGRLLLCHNHLQGGRRGKASHTGAHARSHAHTHTHTHKYTHNSQLSLSMRAPSAFFFEIIMF